MNSGKHLFPGIHRSVNGLKIVRIPTFSSRFLAFPGTVYLGVFSAHRPALHSLSPRVRDSFDLSTVPRPVGYQCSGD